MFIITILNAGHLLVTVFVHCGVAIFMEKIWVHLPALSTDSYLPRVWVKCIKTTTRCRCWIVKLGGSWLNMEPQLLLQPTVSSFLYWTWVCSSITFNCLSIFMNSKWESPVIWQNINCLLSFRELWCCMPHILLSLFRLCWLQTARRGFSMKNTTAEHSNTQLLDLLSHFVVKTSKEC